MSSETENQKRAAIRPVKESTEDELLARPGVVGVDIGEKYSDGIPTGELSIVVYVEEKKPKNALSTKDVIPKTVDGIKTDVQEMVIELQAAKHLLEVDAQIDATSYPTLHGGISMGPSRSIFKEPPEVNAPGNYVFVGTLGAMVRDRVSGATMALTNFHVACVDDSWAVGNLMVQPGRPDGGVPATQQFGTLTRAQLTENTDGAVVTVDADHPWDYTVEGIGDVAGTATATNGMAVQKRGRTTEHTFGDVGSTDATLSVDYGDGLGLRTLRHQIRINTDTSRSARFSNQGDSGSVVMDMDRNVIGLLFAGSADGSTTFANPIAVALDELGVDLLVRPRLVPTRPILTCLTTRLTICEVSRVVVCNIRTSIPICTVSRPVICDPTTRTVTCFVTRAGCPTRTAICELPISRQMCEVLTRGVCEQPDIDPRDFDPRIPGRMGSPYDTNDYGEDPSFLAGYLAALEEISDLEEKDQN
ncbi:MAG: hypothetical protein ACTHWA_13450 [Arachnia sp.]